MTAKRRTSAQPSRHGDRKRLYDAAIAFRDLAPWVWMEDDQLIGVEVPASGAIGYACVMGALGEVFGLAVYRGAAGYHLYQRLRDGRIEPEVGEAHAAMDCIAMTFEDRTDLEARDRREVTDAGLKVRGRNAWPLFRSSKPGYAPWYLENHDVQLMIVAVEQAGEVCRRARTGERLPDLTDPRTVLIRRFDPVDATWRDAWAPPPEPPPLPAAPPPDSRTIAQLRKRKRPGAPVVEVQLIYLTMPIAGAGQRPYFPRVWLQADSRTGVIAMSDLLEPERSPRNLQDAFLSLLGGQQSAPSEIRVADLSSLTLLAPIADALDVPLRRVKVTPALAEAREAMEVMLRRRRTGARAWAD